MIRCLPRGICSWNFSLSGSGHAAEITLQTFGEKGTVTVDGVPFVVRKHGMMSGQWTLEWREKVVVSAQKRSAFTRSFDLDGTMGALVLGPRSGFSQAFALRRGDSVMAEIVRDHLFTRRASIRGHESEWDLPTVCFAFWLTVLCWRRAQNNG